MKINFQNTPKNLDEKMVYNILRDYKILNCEVLIRDDEATVDDLIDVIMKNHRTYIKVSQDKPTFPLESEQTGQAPALSAASPVLIPFFLGLEPLTDVYRSVFTYTTRSTRSVLTFWIDWHASPTRL